MLDMSSEQHVAQSERLNALALAYIRDQKASIQAASEALQRNGQASKSLGDANSKITFVYAVIDGAVERALKNNAELKAGSDAVPEEETVLQRLTRETSVGELNDYIGDLSEAAQDAKKSVADLAVSAVHIKNMRDSYTSQEKEVRDMHQRGIAGIAEAISVAITALGQAAIAESHALNGATMDRMSNFTHRIAQKESMRIAGGYVARNAELEKAIQNLDAYGQVSKQASDVIKTALGEAKRLVTDLEVKTREVSDETARARALHAESLEAEPVATAAKVAAVETSVAAIQSPFGV